MASSDEEGDIIPDLVTNFHFVNKKEEPISFSMLPMQWSDKAMTVAAFPEIFLWGTDYDGQKIYKKVIAWKFELSYVLPEIYVLSRDQTTWIKLFKPRESYVETIRTTLVTIHFVHFVKKNPGESHDNIWNHILKTFSTFEVPPSENDLFDHIPLIDEARLRDKDIAESEYLVTFLSKMHGTRRASIEDSQARKKVKFVCDSDEDDCYNVDGEVEEEEGEPFGSVCAYCDDGGEILCCEGRCIRSFHRTRESGIESSCESLGYTREQADGIQSFLCKNCQFQIHQCFACGLLGSSDKSTGGNVFPCVSATCGQFYHAKCVAKLLFPSDDEKAEELQSKIAAGDSFACPMHKCFECKQVEDKKVYELQFAICRRCPKSYHRKCLPRTIMFESDKEKNIYCRAWEGLLRNRVLIYCMDHDIISKLGTPRRDHLLFPDDNIKKQQFVGESRSSEATFGAGKRSKILGSLEEKPVVKVTTPLKEVYSTSKVGVSAVKVAKGLSEQVCGQKRGLPTDNRMSVIGNYNYSTEGKRESHQKVHQSKLRKVATIAGKINTMQAAMPSLKNTNNAQASEYAEMKRKMDAFIEKTTASFNKEHFIEERKRNSICAQYSKCIDETTITMGKVEASAKAVRAAWKKLEDGGTIEEAKAVCEPEILNQLVRWKRQLQVYLAPFLHATRYTSFGRHFTKVDKLKEVVERLRWYVQDGDTIVDFCCGSNDFSCLMKEALDKMGKNKCSFKNYDLIQPKNVFSFEKRDWMSVGVEELPTGRNLVMGLNPPFGAHAYLANKFIKKALQFSPKLLILIVPRETQQLSYDLIWEDRELLSGKSFYLPGSFDSRGQQLDQGNSKAPPLYLWSHPNWTAFHKSVALEHGHTRMEENIRHLMLVDHVQPSKPWLQPRGEDMELAMKRYKHVML